MIATPNQARRALRVKHHASINLNDADIRALEAIYGSRQHQQDIDSDDFTRFIKRLERLEARIYKAVMSKKG